MFVFVRRTKILLRKKERLTLSDLLMAGVMPPSIPQLLIIDSLMQLNLCRTVESVLQ